VRGKSLWYRNSSYQNVRRTILLCFITQQRLAENLNREIFSLSDEYRTFFRASKNPSLPSKKKTYPVLCHIYIYMESHIYVCVCVCVSVRARAYVCGYTKRSGEYNVKSASQPPIT